VRGLLIALVAVIIVSVDQLTKAWAVRHFSDAPRHVVWTLQFVVQYNSGIAFSQATGATSLVTILALGVLVAMLIFARRTTGMFTAVIFGLIIGGAAGNLADRLVRDHGGAVVDWIDLRWWPVFNVADAAVSIGVVLVLARTLLTPDGPRAG
jgi:signal peptidase II